MQPFKGIRVIDATHVIAGPYATYLLAVLGAEVIKIEHPADPDQTREQGSDLDLKRKAMGTWYLSQNANKRSVTLDLKSPEGVEALGKLIATADVLVENYRPGAFAALGFTDEAVARLNPKIIHCSMSAFGQAGPRASQTGYDMVIQAASGLMAMTGTPETGPTKIGAPVIDYSTGMSAAFAIACALFQRERNNAGQRIDVAMFDVALTLMGLFVTNHDQTGVAPGPVGNRGPYPYTGCYATKDGKLMLGASNKKQQERLWLALDRPDLVKRGDAIHTADREPEFVALTEIFLQRTADEWEQYLQSRHVPASRVRTLLEALDDGQLAHRGVFTEVDAPGAKGPVKVPVAPFTFASHGPGVTQAPPDLGADTDGILAELGYTAAQLRDLKKRGVI